MNTDDALHGISTMIAVRSSAGRSLGSGFFYQQLAPGSGDGTAQWREVLDIWLVTNRHVLLPRHHGRELVPDEFTFQLRKRAGERVVWDPITLTRADLLDRVRFHSKADVDVAAVRVYDLMLERLKVAESSAYMAWYSLHREQLSGRNHIYAEVGDDALLVGYPRGFYDEVNLFPIVKSGVIASRWGVPFNGRPYFLVDAKLFPGSSGSVVITKPRDSVIVEGKLLYAEPKQFAFLGVYSGEPFLQDDPVDFEDSVVTPKLGFNLGIVWYGELVEEIISGDMRPQLAG